MKLTYLTWGYPHDDAIIRAMREAGLMVEETALPGKLISDREDSIDVWEEAQNNLTEKTEDSLRERLQAAAGDIVFSVNFFAVVSKFCQQEEIPYCCWVLQLPNYDLYTAPVRNACNYLGLCDSYLVEKLGQIGVSKAFFLPDAVELGETDGLQRMVSVERETCFVARHPQRTLNTAGMSLYGKGYLESFLHAQRVLYGAYVLEDGLLGRVQQEFLAYNPVSDTILPELQKLYAADRYFAPMCTAMQQDIFLQNFDSIMTIYSDGVFEACKSEKHPFIEKEAERRKIYANKEFTLVLAPHVLHNGIPRDTLEVIAAGGFPIAGFQKDYAYFFKKDESLAFFQDATEFKKAIVRYGNSPEERERVRTAAYRTVAEGHTYRHRIVTMLEMWAKF